MKNRNRKSMRLWEPQQFMKLPKGKIVHMNKLKWSHKRAYKLLKKLQKKGYFVMIARNTFKRTSKPYDE